MRLRSRPAIAKHPLEKLDYLGRSWLSAPPKAAGFGTWLRQFIDAVRALGKLPVACRRPSRGVSGRSITASLAPLAFSGGIWMFSSPSAGNAAGKKHRHARSA